MKETRAYLLSATVGTLLLLPMAYVASYLALLAPSEPFVEPTKGHFILRQAEYRVGGATAQFIYSPLHDIDGWIRPKFWCDLSEGGRRWSDEP